MERTEALSARRDSYSPGRLSRLGDIAGERFARYYARLVSAMAELQSDDPVDWEDGKVLLRAAYRAAEQARRIIAVGGA